MSRNEIGWELYRTFLSVLTEGSLSAAARALGITQPTAGRHIASLERALGIVLFTRCPSGLLPTEAALGIRSHALAMESTAAALERAARSHAGDGVVKGVVRVSCSDVIGLEVLPPALAKLRREHPGLTIELALSDRLHDMLRGEADLAVRMVRPSQAQLIARHVGRIELGLHAHRDYLQRHGTPQTLDELASHAVVGHDRPTDYLRKAEKGLPAWRREIFSLRCDSNFGQLALLRAGAGVGLCQVPLARRDDALVRVLEDEVALGLDTWVTMHEDLRHSARCRVTFDALVDALLAHVGAD